MTIISRRELWRINLRDARESLIAWVGRWRDGENVSYENWSRSNYRWAYEEAVSENRHLREAIELALRRERQT